MLSVLLLVGMNKLIIYILVILLIKLWWESLVDVIVVKIVLLKNDLEVFIKSI